MLKGKTVLLGVTGGIACYKSAGLASALVKQGANVQVLMTRNATEFIGPHTFESLTGNRVSVDTFDRNYQFQVEHIALSDQATWYWWPRPRPTFWLSLPMAWPTICSPPPFWPVTVPKSPRPP